jgi:hypothetical protein
MNLQSTCYRVIPTHELELEATDGSRLPEDSDRFVRPGYEGLVAFGLLNDGGFEKPERP